VEIVTSVMVHGPCGNDNPEALCMEQDKLEHLLHYTKNYPQEFSEYTIVPKDGYPKYHCRNDGRT
jgi:hypothetical protein